MRKIVAVATALLLSVTALGPAQAATVKVGGACPTLLAVAKAGTSKVYCGKNKNKRTRAKVPRVWIRSVDCYDLISAYNKVKVDYDSAVKQIEDIKAQIAAVPGDTTGLQVTVKGFEDTVKVFAPTVASMRGQVVALCS